MGWKKDGLSTLKSIADKANADLQIFTPSAADLPFLLYQDARSGVQGRIYVDAPSGADVSAKPLRVQALGAGDQLLDERRFDTQILQGLQFPLAVDFDLQGAALHDVRGYRIAGVRGVNARYDLDGTGGAKTVRIATSGKTTNRAQQYTKDSFYLQKALEPFASVALSPLSAILDEKTINGYPAGYRRDARYFAE